MRDESIERVRRSYLASVRIGGDKLYIGAYPSETDAMLAHDHWLAELSADGAPYFPRITAVDPRLRRATGKRDGSICSSQFINVMFDADHGLWQARLARDNRTVHLGYHDSQERAARAVGRIIRADLYYRAESIRSKTRIRKCIAELDRAIKEVGKSYAS